MTPLLISVLSIIAGFASSLIADFFVRGNNKDLTDVNKEQVKVQSLDVASRIINDRANQLKDLPEKFEKMAKEFTALKDDNKNLREINDQLRKDNENIKSSSAINQAQNEEIIANLRIIIQNLIDKNKLDPINIDEELKRLHKKKLK
ncbi:hypothetical protein [Oenococcus phage Vinitor-27]|nr:hypothetical protein [Oenococcus phage Vinitor-27]